MLVFALGALAQLYYFHYRSALFAHLTDRKDPNINVYLVFYGILVCLMQLLKVGWLFAINFFTLRLK